DEDRAWAEGFLDGAAAESVGAAADTRAGAASAAQPQRRPFVAIHPGGSKAPRAWHAERFAELAHSLAPARRPAPLAGGAAGDAAAGAEIARAVPGTLVAAGRTTVRRMGALIERSALFIGNDSGPMHIAGALGTPTVGIFGPGTQEKTSPRGGGGAFEAVTLRFPCSPCKQNFFHECDPAPTGKPYCLENIDVAMLL